MKTKSFNRDSFQKAAAWTFIGVGVLLLFLGCEKQEMPPVKSNETTSASDLRLLGQWQLRQVNSYEISGTDSSGAAVCTLIGSEIPDSACISRFMIDAYTAAPGYHKALGSIAGCNSIAFAWRTITPDLLETSDGASYLVTKCSADSLVLEWTMKKDILRLKQEAVYSRP